MRRRDKLFIASAILLLICIFSINYKLMAFGFIQFIAMIIYCTVKLHGGTIFKQFAVDTLEQGSTHLNNKQYHKAFFFHSIIIFMIMGMSIVVVNIIAFIFFM